MRYAIAAALLAIASPAMATQEAPFHRSGLYVGATVGWETGELDPEGVGSFFGEGATGGAFVGYQARLDGLVLGIELDAMLRDIDWTGSDEEFTVRAAMDYLGSARARVGIPMGAMLFYGTAGIAFTQSELKVDGLFSEREWLTGFAYGAGIEGDLTRNMFGRLEAIEYVFEKEDFGVDANLDSSTTVIRAAIGFRLN